MSRNLQAYLGSLRGLTLMNMRSPWLLLVGLFIGGLQLVFFVGTSKLPPVSTQVAVVDLAHSPSSDALVHALRALRDVKLTQVDAATATSQFERDRIDVVLTVPPELGRPTPPVRIDMQYKTQSRGEQSVPAIRSAITSFNESLVPSHPLALLAPRVSHQRSLGFLDILLPGILSIVVVASTGATIGLFTQYRRTGVLRRVQATGISPSPFVLAFCTLLLVTGMAQALALTGIAAIFYPLHLDLTALFALTLLGYVVFIALGLVVAGWVRDPNAANGLSQLAFLQVFISYIPTESRPPGTGYIPAALLADGFHQVTVGNGAISLQAALLGLAAWAVLLVGLSLRAFRWDTE